MKTYTKDELSEILTNHAKWLLDEDGGSRANLYGANLSNANLSRANLYGANLSDADLSRADLYDADLSNANLSGANLSDADLYGANLSRADLYDADLSNANLSDADLSRADLSRADLSRANLSNANLSGANLSNANLSGANLKSIDLTTRIDTGETWGEYLKETVPALLAAGGKTLAAIIGAGVWDCHDWTNCPMAEAFSVHSMDDVPILYRPRVEQFVRFFDAGLIPKPEVVK